MTLDDIKLLEHIDVIEGEYNIAILPEYNYYVEVEDVPQHQFYFEPFEMIIQPEYSQMWVLCVDPSTDIDTSL